MRPTSREEWRRLASVLLVAVVATFSLPVGASLLAPATARTSVPRASVRRVQAEIRTDGTSRRSAPSRDAFVVAAALLFAALVVIGLIRLADAPHLAWAPALLAVQRGPPSSR